MATRETETIGANFEKDLLARRGAVAKAVADWLGRWTSGPTTGDAEQLRERVRTLDADAATSQARASITRTEAWYEERREAFLRALGAEHGVDADAMRVPDEPEGAKGWLPRELEAQLDALRDALEQFRQAAERAADAATAAPEPAEGGTDRAAAAVSAGDDVARARERAVRFAEGLEGALAKSVLSAWRAFVEKVRSGAEDRAVDAARERADRAAARRAARQSEAEAAAAAGGEKKDSKDKPRAWWQWALDIAMLAAIAYMVKVRFFPSAQGKGGDGGSGAASASARPEDSATVAGPRGTLPVGPTEVRAGPGGHFAVVEALAAGVSRVELVDRSTPPGWLKVRLPSGKEGWIPEDAIVRPAPPAKK